MHDDSDDRQLTAILVSCQAKPSAKQLVADMLPSQLHDDIPRRWLLSLPRSKHARESAAVATEMLGRSKTDNALLD